MPAQQDSKSGISDLDSEPLPPADANNRLDPLPDGAGGDPMSDVLDTIRLHGAMFFVWEPSSPYAVGVADGALLSRHILPAADCMISYHIVTRGPCWAAVNGEDPQRLETGDILVLPRGDAYKIADTPQFPSAEDEQESITFLQAMANGELPSVVRDDIASDVSSRLICGFLGCNLRPYNPLLSTLPRMIRLPAPERDDDPLSQLIDFALGESKQRHGGEKCLLKRLSEVMFVEVLRRYLRLNHAPESGWLGALRHPVVGRALGLLHGDLARSWTLQRLAREVGTSRSTLSKQFRVSVGMPPMQYLGHWRMQVAADRLRDRSVKVYRVALEVGYESEAAFSRAFKRIVGTAPAVWRAQRK